MISWVVRHSSIVTIIELKRLWMLTSEIRAWLSTGKGPHCEQPLMNTPHIRFGSIKHRTSLLTTKTRLSEVTSSIKVRCLLNPSRKSIALYTKYSINGLCFTYHRVLCSPISERLNTLHSRPLRHQTRAPRAHRQARHPTPSRPPLPRRFYSKQATWFSLRLATG